jgi:periplasmic protein TonB
MRRRARASFSRVLVPLTPAQRALDPLHEPPRPGRDAWLPTTLGLTASLAMHGAVVALGLAAAGSDAQTAAASSPRVTITMRPDPPPPLPPVTLPPPEPPAPRVQPPPSVPAPRPRKPPPSPPPDPPPRAAASEPPPSVVGVQPESLLEGGAGPAFAAGHTLAGTTDASARARDEIARTRPRPIEPPTASTSGQGLALTFPRRKRPTKPEYPALLERQGIEADVQVRVDLDREGRVARVSILTPAAQPEFNRAARATALAEQFEPARRGGEPIPYSLSFTYRFRLETGR